MTSSVARSSCMNSPGTSSIWKRTEEVNGKHRASPLPSLGRLPTKELQSQLWPAGGSFLCAEPSDLLASLCPCCLQPHSLAHASSPRESRGSPQNVRSCWSRQRGEEGGRPASCPSDVGMCGRQPSHPGPPRSCLRRGHTNSPLTPRPFSSDTGTNPALEHPLLLVPTLHLKIPGGQRGTPR